MNLVTSIYTLDDLKLLGDKLDYALIHIPYLSINYKNIDIKEALDYCKDNGIKPVLSLNRIFHPKDLESVSSLIADYKNYDILFYIADLGALNLFLKNGLINKVIYNPETMITNYLDMNEYYSLGLNSVGVSSEITINDLKKICEINNNVFYQVFGKRLMFYSRRKLISLYGDKNNDSYPKNNVYLRESTRKDYFPIVENENGTLIYRSYNISLLPFMDNLDIKYAYIESFDINMDLFKNINDIYYDFIHNNIDLSMAKIKLNELDLNIEDGFIYKDSVYQKEEF
ncbi:MAG: U32 family peptidase [Acholeplasmatales bacterium]|nr:U32 family peptidase [Acholeplasmatales bacterium]